MAALGGAAAAGPSDFFDPSSAAAAGPEDGGVYEEWQLLGDAYFSRRELFCSSGGMITRLPLHNTCMKER